MAKSSTVEVDLSQLREGWNPRRTFDIKGLAEDIRKRGLLVPLEVREVSDGFEIVDGVRRFRAMMYLEVEKIQVVGKVPVVLVDADENEAAVMKFTRFEFSEGITEADRIQALADRWEFESAGSVTTQEAFADRYGVSRSTVANAMRFVKAPKKVRALVEKGELTPAHVTKAVLKFKTKKDQVAFAEGFVDRRFGHGGGSVRQAVELADRYLKERLQEEEFERLQKEAEVKTCPQCGSPPRALTALSEGYKVVDLKRIKEGEDVPVFQCSKGSTYNAHHWNPVTGDLLYSSWDADSKVRREKAVQERKKKTTTTRKKRAKGEGIFEPAWFFSRSSIEWWAQELLRANLEDVRALNYEAHGIDVYVKKPQLGFSFRIAAADVDDGRGGKYLTRVTLLQTDRYGFRSGAREDHVGEGGHVQPIKSRRTRLLKFAYENDSRPTPKKPEDWLPKSVPFPGEREGAFTLGQRVKLNDDRKSYNGKKTRILAFNMLGPGDPVEVLLDLSMAQKVFPLSSLTPLEEKA